MPKTLMLCALLLLPACAAKPPIVSIPPARCADLVPPDWAQGVQATPIPDTTGMTTLDALKAWAGAYVGTSGQLEKANGRTADAIGIVTRCEAMVNEARPKT